MQIYKFGQIQTIQEYSDASPYKVSECSLASERLRLGALYYNAMKASICLIVKQI